MSLRQGDAALRQLRLHPARARPRSGRGRRDRPRHGHHVDAQGLPGRDARRPRERRLAARDGDGVREHRLRRLPAAADGDQEDRVPGRPRRAGQEPAAALPREEDAHLRGRRGRRGDADPRAEHPGRHRHARRDRLPRGRQDGHDRRQHGRLVRRLHAALRDRRLGRLPEGRHPDELALLRRARRRRHVPGRDVGRLHEPDQGRLLRGLHAAGASLQLAAVLRQLRGGKSIAGAPDEESHGRAQTETPTDPGTGGTTPDDSAPEQDEGGEGFDPGAYESPPQPEPETARRRPRTPTAAPPRRQADTASHTAQRSRWYNPRRRVRQRGGRSMREGSARQHPLAHRFKQ